MAEQLIINLPEGVSVASVLDVVAKTNGYAAEIPSMVPMTEDIEGEVAAAARADEIKKAGHQFQGADVVAANTFRLRWIENQMHANPMDAETFARDRIAAVLRQTYAAAKLAILNKANQEAINKELEGGSIG